MIYLLRLSRATMVIGFLLTTEVRAEQLCFVSSDCQEAEICKPVQSSAMGLCQPLRDFAAERRAQDTQNFNPWVQDGGIDNSNGGSGDE